MRMMVAAGFVLLLLGCASNPSEEGSWQATIEPAQFYLNRVTLGDDEDTIEAEIGLPTRLSAGIDGERNVPYAVLHYAGMTIVLDDGEAGNVRCSQACITRDGIKTGMRRDQVAATYGLGEAGVAGGSELLSYRVDDGPELLMFTLRDDRVTEIELWRPPTAIASD